MLAAHIIQFPHVPYLGCLLAWVFKEFLKLLRIRNRTRWPGASHEHVDLVLRVPVCSERSMELGIVTAQRDGPLVADSLEVSLNADVVLITDCDWV